MPAGFRLSWHSLVAASMLFPTAVHLVAQESKSSGPVSVNVLPELLPFKPGMPLTNRTPVARPTPIRGLLSWTIETRRHRGWIYSVAVSPDGRLIASGGLDGTIRIWDAESGAFVRAFAGHNSYVYGLAFSPDGSALISGGSFDHTARIWNTKTGQLLRTIAHPTYVTRVAWSSDGRMVAVGGGHSGHVLFWEVGNHNVEVAKLEMGQGILAISWSPNSAKVAMGVVGQPAHILDGHKPKVIASAGLDPYNVQGMAWSADSRYLGVATSNGSIVWDTTEDKLARSLPAAGDLAWSPDGKTLAMVSAGVAKFYQADTGTELEMAGPSGTAIQWSANGKLLVSNTNAAVSIWDAVTRKVRHTINVGGSHPQIQWALHGRALITGEGTNSVSIWETLHARRQRELKGHAAAISSIAVTTNGKLIATASHDKTIRIWEVSSGKLQHTLEGHAGPVTCVAWTASGNSLASGSTDKTVRIWDASKGKLERTLEGHTERVNVVAWAAKSLASGSSDGNVILWNVNSGQETSKVSVNAPLQSLAWTDDGKILAIGCTESYLIIWNAATGMPVARIDRGGSPPAVSSLAWNTQGILAAGRGNHTMQLWSGRSTEKPIHDIQVMAPVQSVAWSRDGKTIVASASDRSMRSWDAASGVLRGTVVANETQIAMISPEGHYRVDSEDDSELVYIAQTDMGQETLKPSEFAARYRWKNLPASVRLAGD